MAAFLERCLAVARLLASALRAAAPAVSADGPDSATLAWTSRAFARRAEPEGRPRGGGGAPRSDAAPRFVLTVDDAGEFLVAAGDRLTVGHLRAGAADLLFLADVGPEHAELARRESLRAGSTWWIAPLCAEPVVVGGERIGRPTRLSDGDRVDLGENLAFRFRVPDPASHTVALELLGAAECAGARHVLLFGAGEGGRIRIGSAEHRHVRVPNLEHELALVRDGAKLLVRCRAGVSGAGERTPRGFVLPCPPPQRFDLSVGRASGDRPPFGVSIAPARFGGRGDA